MKRLLGISLAFVLALSLSMVPVPAQPALAATTYTVDDDWQIGSAPYDEDTDLDTDFATIKAALDSAMLGDTVHVAAGNYSENIELKDGVEVVSDRTGDTIIKGKGGSNLPVVIANSVGSTTKLDGFIIADGSSSGIGGGIQIAWDSSPIISNCIITGNIGGAGGGIAVYLNSSPNIINCTITGNIATDFGGGILVWQSSPTIYNCIIINNSAGDGGGIYVYNSTPIADYNDVWNNFPTNYVGCNAGLNDISADPLFVAAGDYHLQDTSPCIDRGDNAAVPAWLTTDFDGDPRIMGTAVDIGANECGVPPPVPATIDIDPDTLNLKSKGVFTAYITLPEGYDVADIDMGIVTCEGAPAVRGVTDGGILIAKFNIQDLNGVPTGKEVELTVSGNLLDGTPFTGSDIIRVISKGK